MVEEFKTTFNECDKSGKGLLELSDFKAFMTKQNENMKKRFGQSDMGDDAEMERWYNAYNNITPLRTGVSIGDCMEADGVLKELGEMGAAEHAKTLFEPLVRKALTRMMRFKPDTMVKMRKMMRAQYDDPALWEELKQEFMRIWKESDANADGVLDMAEFKVFVSKYNDAMKARNGEAEKGDEREDEKWYEAYNLLSPNKEGVSMVDFRTGRDMFREAMIKIRMEPLIEKAMQRMSSYKKETQAKIGEYMQAEEKNPDLFNEVMAEFQSTWKICDANNDCLLDLAEYKEFAVKHNENMKRRWGESRKGSEEEDEQWYEILNAITPSYEGIAERDFKKARETIGGLIRDRMHMNAFK